VDATGVVAVTDVTVPPLDGAVFTIVKLGYVPLVDIPVPAVRLTVWSGAVFVIFNVPEVVIGDPVTAIPVPAVAATDVTVPEPEDGGTHPLALRICDSCPAKGCGTSPCSPSVETVGAVKVPKSTIPVCGAIDITYSL
jgi:hypothetical protein